MLSKRLTNEIIIIIMLGKVLTETWTVLFHGTERIAYAESNPRNEAVYHSRTVFRKLLCRNMEERLPR